MRMGGTHRKVMPDSRPWISSPVTVVQLERGGSLKGRSMTVGMSGLSLSALT